MFDPSDVLLRLVDVWYDVLWSFHHRASRSVEAPASAAQRMKALDDRLRTARQTMPRTRFETICDVALNNDDDLYPGLEDVLEMVHALTGNEETTFVEAFEALFFGVCDFLVANDRDAVTCKKMLLTPRKTKQSSYDLCRRTFCEVLADRPDVVTRGLATMRRPVEEHEEAEAEAEVEEEHEDAEEVESETSETKASELEQEAEEHEQEPIVGVPFPVLDLASSDEDDSEDDSEDSG